MVHRGRRTGRIRRTPVNVYRRGDGFVVALVYGTDAQWVRNVVAAGGCELRTRGRTYRLTAPEVYRDRHRGAMGAVVRRLLRIVEVDEFIWLRIQTWGGPTT